LNKQKFHQISCSGRSGMHWQYRMPNWYEIAKRLGSPALDGSISLKFLLGWELGYNPSLLILWMTCWVSGSKVMI